MKHQPFEDWLFSEDDLAPEQEDALQEHLDECERCEALDQAWTAVHMEIRRTPPVVPTPGFAQRFEARLAAERTRQQMRLTWILLGVFLIGALAVSLVTVSLSGGLPEATSLFTNAAYLAAWMYNTITNLVVVAIGIANVVSPTISIGLWVIAASALLAWTMVWIVAIWRLPMIERSFQK